MARIAHCRVGADRFAVDLNALDGIERTDRLQLAPAEAAAEPTSAPVGWLLGEREDVPVYRLGQLLGRRPGERTEVRQGVVLVCPGGGSGRFGVLVDGIERSRRPAGGAEAIHPLPEPFLRARLAGFRGVVQEEAELSLLLDLAALLTAGIGEGRKSAGVEAEEVPPRAGGTGRGPSPSPGARRASRVLIADLLARSGAGRRVSIALPTAQVLEVVEATPVLVVPGAPRRLPGLILWRDQALPVLDLAQNLPGPARPSIFDRPADRFVIATTGTGQVALPVGRDVRFERLPLAAAAAVEARESTVREVLGVYEMPDSLLLVFDLVRSLAGADLA